MPFSTRSPTPTRTSRMMPVIGARQPPASSSRSAAESAAPARASTVPRALWTTTRPPPPATAKRRRTPSSSSVIASASRRARTRHAWRAHLEAASTLRRRAEPPLVDRRRSRSRALAADPVRGVLRAPAIVPPARRNARRQRAAGAPARVVLVERGDDRARVLVPRRRAGARARVGRQVLLDEVRVELARRRTPDARARRAGTRDWS